MDHPDTRVQVSVSEGGNIAPPPEKPVAVVVTTRLNKPVGLLEKWDPETWVYADAESLVPIHE